MVECPECDGEGETWLGDGEGCLDPECCSPKKTCPLCSGGKIVTAAQADTWRIGHG